MISAGVMELADVTDSKSVGSDTVWVRVPPPAPEKRPSQLTWSFFNEIRFSASEILLRNVKYASRVKYLLRKCQLTIKVMPAIPVQVIRAYCLFGFFFVYVQFYISLKRRIIIIQAYIFI